jgi:lon-related putative ATP-dependent protease
MKFELDPADLYRRCDPDALQFDTTAALPEPDTDLGQERALAALEFGLSMRAGAFNLYALGPPGIGKHAIVTRLVHERAEHEAVADDWCYVHNFTDPVRPRSLRLPATRGADFKRAMERLLDELRGAIPALFEDEDFRTRREAIEEEAKHKHEQAFSAVQRKAKERNFVITRTPVGMMIAPLREGHAIDSDAFQRLPAAEQEKIRTDTAEIEHDLQAILREIPEWEREARVKMREFVESRTAMVVIRLIGTVRERYRDLSEVLSYLDAVQRDAIENASDFLHEPGAPPGRQGGPVPEGNPLRRYLVNLIVDRTGERGAPVVYEDHPTHPNLLGRVEHLAQFGALVTDFSLLRSGALHRANGGYLLLDARRVLMQPFAWEELKRVLRARQLRIESLAQTLSLISTVSLEPEPIPIDVKVILIGDRYLYYLLAALDPDFPELFKVSADFEEDIERNPNNLALLARLLGALARRAELRPIARGGVARLIEQATRLAEDTKKLSVHERELNDLLHEADWWAAKSGAAAVEADHVQRALDAQVSRSDRVRERIYEQIERGTILIDTKGEAIGQVNGLAVSQLGNFAFARPSRITARVRLGSGKVVDIEREVELGGPSHSKGVLILQGYLAGRFCPDLPLSLSASLVFEQSYGGIDGDSASAAELFALVSALGEIPMKQSIAVTGSINQQGQIQAIGGVNEKIEGFFDVCRRLGLTGTQGVMIPRANAQHLMLRRDIVEAAVQGKFHVYAIENADEGLEILSGLEAGTRAADGRFPPASANARIEARLVALAQKGRAFGRDPDKDGKA